VAADRERIDPAMVVGHSLGLGRLDVWADRRDVIAGQLPHLLHDG
jgi:hypothetical protein